MPYSIPGLVRRERTESDAARDDLVADLVTALPEALILALGTAVVGTLVARRIADEVSWACVAAALLLTIARVVVVHDYRRRRAVGAFQGAALRRWEWRYGGVSVGFAFTVGMIGMVALQHDDPRSHMLSMMLAFSFAGGLIARLAVRPSICMLSLAGVVIPILIGLGFRSFGPDGGDFAATFVVALLFATAAIRCISHRYCGSRRLVDLNHEFAAQALRDPLTGLPNRVHLPVAFADRLDASQRTGRGLALHCLDLDGFKQVNDQLGHAAGDLLLQAVAGRLRNVVQGKDLVARVGGDEFVVVQCEVGSLDHAQSLAARLIRVLSEPFGLGDATVEIGLSVGIALSAGASTDLTILAGCADAALYAAKRAGRGQAVVYRPGENERFGVPRWSEPNGGGLPFVASAA